MRTIGATSLSVESPSSSDKVYGSAEVPEPPEFLRIIDFIEWAECADARNEGGWPPTLADELAR